MKYIMLFTGEDNKSYFHEIDIELDKKHPLGNYSNKLPVKGMTFRDFEQGATFDWHTAPQPQYIIYLEGKVEVEASGGEKRIFEPGDILFATDLTGEGHITRMHTKGRSIIITTNDEPS